MNSVSRVMFHVRKRPCSTCIYRSDCLLDLEHLEQEVRDLYVGFRSWRVCHDPPCGDEEVCCRGFWNRHKDKFAVGQLAQRLSLVKEVG